MVEKTTNIHERLAEVAKLVEVLQKDKAVMTKFKYVTEEAILNPLMLGMEQQRLALYPMIVPGTLKISEQIWDKKGIDKTGKAIVTTIHENVISAEMVMRWVNLDNPSEILDIPWVIVGQQADAAQSLGSALTYSTRYFYLKFFHIATTEDDPDNWRMKQNETEEKQTQAVLADVLADITTLCTNYVNGDKDKMEVLTNFMKDATNDKPNYNKIKNLEVALDLKTKVKEFTTGKKEE